jgi:hypothetical protein
LRKTVGLALNKYNPIPESLRSGSGSSTPLSQLNVEAASLYHHYYLDTRECAPPNPDPAQFEHITLLLPCTELRVRGNGFGKGTAFRKHRSNELGQAFCRWFLYEHLDITYFAHMEEVLDRAANPLFGGMTVERIETGDAPDYLCAENQATVFLAEAKGRITAVSFANAEFQTWRDQFRRVVVKDSTGTSRSVKGHIVATRFATETNRPSVKSTLFAEDPASPGEQPLREAPSLGAMVMALHYASIATKIRQPLLAAALQSGVPVPEEIQFPAAVWEFRTPPLQGKRFVGGYFPGSDGAAPIQVNDGNTVFLSSNPWRLDVAAGTFFGVEENIFRSVCAMGRAGDVAAAQVGLFPDFPPIYSGLSLLRDGSVIGPVEFFNPVGFNVY